jgi:hypothetical protein
VCLENIVSGSDTIATLRKQSVSPETIASVTKTVVAVTETIVSERASQMHTARQS